MISLRYDFSVEVVREILFCSRFFRIGKALYTYSAVETSSHPDVRKGPTCIIRMSERSHSCTTRIIMAGGLWCEDQTECALTDELSL
jgi:hypothetical protein